jgi:biofilm PGA synthesis N-glycosyltransferase PgaC
MTPDWVLAGARLIACFVFAYPIVMAVVWIVGGLWFWWRRERRGAEEDPDSAWPEVTVLVPCHNEAAGLGGTLRALAALDYPDYRVLFIDDASTDGTARVIREALNGESRFHLLRLSTNLGKAGALNAALELVRTPLIVVLDSDTIPRRDCLRPLAAPFLRQPRLGAVTANPLPLNRSGFLANLQTAEFASIIGLIKRSQRTWGRIFTVSGCCTAYRTEALRRVGGFSPATATEDIDVTWRLQRDAWEIWFEPRAVVRIQVPVRLPDYWRQRRRWALGGWHALRTHRDVFTRWRWRRLWPIYVDFVLAYAWGFCFVAVCLFWLGSRLLGWPPGPASPVPAWHGAVASLVCLAQTSTAALVNHRYDPRLKTSLFWVPWYPLLFFATGAFLAVSTASRGLFGTLDLAGRWRSPPREAGPGGEADSGSKTSAGAEGGDAGDCT